MSCLCCAGRFIQLYERMLRGQFPTEERPLMLRRLTLRGTVELASAASGLPLCMTPDECGTM